MPRIEAPTLAEHRDNRRTALLAAGHDLALRGGRRAVTMAAVAARTGLSRPAVYEYFHSTEELLAAVLLEEMQTWADEVTEALSGQTGPDAQVRAYIRTSLRLIADGRHELLATVSVDELPAAAQREFAVLHATLAAPLSGALQALGVTDTETAVRYVQGVVEAAARRIAPGDAIDREVERVLAFTMGGLAALD